ncbi:MAG: sulfurtransferase TusA family protein [Bacillota bacterium]|nr:sulfurtransferase TusA family protein [Bacillota bacterium]
MKIDARGLSCPQPVLLTQQALKASPATVEVLVDNKTAEGNISRFAAKAGYKVSSREENEEFILTLTK